MQSLNISDVYLKCIRCGYEMEARDPSLLLSANCPRCNGFILLRYNNPRFKVRRNERGIWRYSILPLFESKVTLGEGLTPVSKVENVFVKDEKFNPTGLYSDRASALLASFVKDLGLKKLCVEYSPEFTKSIIQYLEGLDLSIYSDSIMSIDPDDLLFFATRDIEIEVDINPASFFIQYENPLTIEGLKTIVFELFEKEIDVENIVVPAKTGILALSIYKGILDLAEAGVYTNYQAI
ncbi:MAG: pyridoxal-5'-phosphate-dependent protein subunit beta, partial [Desulfurococcaceae archaeon]